MANIFHIKRADNEIILGTTDTLIEMTGRSTLTGVCTVAAGLSFQRVTCLQTDATALTGTLRGTYIDVSNGSTAATGTIRAMELKARTEAPGDTGNDVNVLEGLSISTDSKAHSVTTMRAAEFILDGKTAGTIDEAVGLRIANNLQIDKATISYGLQIYRDSFDYTADIQLSNGMKIGTPTSTGLGLKLDTSNYLYMGYLKLGGERRILANGPGVNQGITINAQGNDGVYFNYTDGGSAGVYFYNGSTQKLAQIRGTTYGECRLFDEDYAEWLQFACSSGYGYLEVKGTAPQPLILNNSAESDVWLFQASASGETQGYRVYGYKAGDAKRYLDITTGGTANDTVDFIGVSNYKFGGTLKSTGGAQLGDGGTTNYTNIAVDGEITLVGTARVKQSAWLGVNALKAPGTKPAAFKEWGISGVWEFSDATDDTIVANIRIPNDMDITVAPSFMIGWSTNTAVTAETAVWQLEYLYTAPGEDTTAVAQETLTVQSNAVAQADGLIEAEITGMDLPGATDSCIHCRIKRLGADGNDDLTDTAELHGICLRYTANKLGTAT